MTRSEAIAVPAKTFADWFVPPLVVPVLLCFVVVLLSQM
jgi:hypothetical protein